ncbi:putative RNA polymerase subunit [Rosellinia necatrix]|uniref:Putative RNA polymerase subunit n=1 Tax=Rosellinia necatrix TaxID=77044 RepID=A0A1W2TVS1_ROSNE|nr:putative RNA polymerase subunit [Rosellinia necatrix]
MRNTRANIGSLSSMANKVRQEKKNGAAAKAKAPLPRARESKKPFKSNDTVEDSSSDSDSSKDSTSDRDSDSDSDLDAARAKFLAGKAAKQKKAVDGKANGAKLATTPAKPLAKGSIPSSAQKPREESESDSTSSESETSDSDSRPPSSGKPVASQAKTVANKGKEASRSESTSSSGSSSESDIDNENVATKNTVVNGKPQTGDNNVESDSDSGSESDDEDDDANLPVARTNGGNAATGSTSQMSRTQWLNNSDFTLRKASSDNPGKEVAEFLSNANLEGKQVWYFTAPASLPITVLKDMEIDLSKATQGESLVTHKGDNYGLDLEPYATSTQIRLLIPSHGGDKYTSLNHSIDSTVHLRRMAKFGPNGEIQATATDGFVPMPKPVREQPEGLRIRYTPIGVPSAPVPSVVPTRTTHANTSSSQTGTKVGVESSSSSESGSESDSDVEMTSLPDPTPSARPTKSAKSSAAEDRKRKHPDSQDQAAKRLKAERSTKVPSVQDALIQTPTSTPMSDATPSKKPSTKAKDNKEKAKKARTPKSTVMTPATAKQTPVPLPSYPGMKR